MSRLWLNIRFGTRHLKVGDPRWWSVRISRNESHDGLPEGRFAIYAPFVYPVPSEDALGGPRNWTPWRKKP